MPANVGKMFYYGEMPWHGEGTRLLQPANATEAMDAGGLNWQVELVPLETVDRPPSPVFRRKAVVRTYLPAGHCGRVLGVVHPGFHPLQNCQGMEMMEALLGNNKRVYHTGGYLGDGEVVWLLARLPQEIKVGEDDLVEPYLLFTNSHDGTIAIDFRLTAVRVVCQNTLTLALRSRSTAIFKRAHQGSYKNLQANARQFFKTVLDAATELEQRLRGLRAVPFSPAQFKLYVEDLVPLPRPPTRAPLDEFARQAYERRVEKAKTIRRGILKVYDSGIRNEMDIPPSEATLWGALNAVTAFVDHAQPTGKVDRYVHAMFGSGADLKYSAYRLALNCIPNSVTRPSLLN
jgi:phage/plasmid-like protein (TIGR03299 family)